MTAGCSDSNGPDGDGPDTTQPNIPDTSEGIRPDSTSAGFLEYIGVYNVIGNGVSQGIAMKDEYLYVGDGQRIKVLDVSDPGSPSQLAEFPSTSSNYITGLAIQGNYLYAVFENRLRIFDISSAISPAEIGSLSIGGSCRDIDIFGDYVFVGRYSSGLTGIDASDVFAPETIKTWFSYPAYSLTIGAGGLLYVGSESNYKIFQLDIMQPESLSQVATTYPSGETGFDMDYIYGHLFVASGKAEMASNNGIFSIKSRDFISLDVFTDTTDFVCKGVAVEGNSAYVIDASTSGNSNLYLYYVYNPSAAYRADYEDLSAEAVSILVKDGYIYILCKTRLLVYSHNIIS